MKVSELKTLLSEGCLARGWKIGDLANAAGVARATAQKALDGTLDPKISTTIALLEAVGVVLEPTKLLSEPTPAAVLEARDENDSLYSPQPNRTIFETMSHVKRVHSDPYNTAPELEAVRAVLWQIMGDADHQKELARQLEFEIMPKLMAIQPANITEARELGDLMRDAVGLQVKMDAWVNRVGGTANRVSEMAKRAAETRAKMLEAKAFEIVSAMVALVRAALWDLSLPQETLDRFEIALGEALFKPRGLPVPGSQRAADVVDV
jgi:hypothetical protein